MRYPVPLHYCLFCHVSFVSFTKIFFKMFALGKHGHFLSEKEREKWYLFALKISLSKIPFIHLCHFFWDEGSPEKCTATLLFPCCFRWTTLRPSDLAAFKSCLSLHIFATPFWQTNHISPSCHGSHGKGHLPRTDSLLHVHFNHLWCLSNGISLLRQRTKRMIKPLS